MERGGREGDRVREGCVREGDRGRGRQLYENLVWRLTVPVA